MVLMLICGNLFVGVVSGQVGRIGNVPPYPPLPVHTLILILISTKDTLTQLAGCPQKTAQKQCCSQAGSYWLPPNNVSPSTMSGVVDLDRNTMSATHAAHRPTICSAQLNRMRNKLNCFGNTATAGFWQRDWYVGDACAD